MKLEDRLIDIEGQLDDLRNKLAEKKEVVETPKPYTDIKNYDLLL